MGFCLRAFLLNLQELGYFDDKRDIDFLFKNNLEPSPLVVAAMIKMFEKIYPELAPKEICAELDPECGA